MVCHHARRSASAPSYQICERFKDEVSLTESIDAIMDRLSLRLTVWRHDGHLPAAMRAIWTPLGSGDDAHIGAHMDVPAR
jgi:hypothetical protein